ncbi:MAG TPA: helix-turn-helix domain-containing protein [Burkholderiales bacterium]|nr:helix-turn-helix domain-containing protein [Burkholderiales bacterium]
MQQRWMAAGLEALRKGGVAGVRIERLAADLGISKGSFYWHFRDRGHLLRELLDFWAREMTELEFERIARLPPRLDERLLALARDVLEKGLGRYDPAIRGWARTDRSVAAAVERVDGRRVRALAQLFEQGGFAAAQARLRARLFYTFLLGEPQVRAPRRHPGELERMVAMLAAR